MCGFDARRLVAFRGFTEITLSIYPTECVHNAFCPDIFPKREERSSVDLYMEIERIRADLLTFEANQRLTVFIVFVC